MIVLQTVQGPNYQHLFLGGGLVDGACRVWETRFRQQAVEEEVTLELVEPFYSGDAVHLTQ